MMDKWAALKGHLRELKEICANWNNSEKSKACAGLLGMILETMDKMEKIEQEAGK